MHNKNHINKTRISCVKPNPTSPPIRWCATIALLALTSLSTHAANLYWDGGTTNNPGTGDGASTFVSGAWGTSITNWDQGSGLPYTNWVNGNLDSAIFGGTYTTGTKTVTLSNAITVNQVIINTGYYTNGAGNYTIGATALPALTFGGTYNDSMPAIDTSAGTMSPTITARITGTIAGGLVIKDGNNITPPENVGRVYLNQSATNDFIGDITVLSGNLHVLSSLGNPNNNIILKGGALFGSSGSAITYSIARNIIVSSNSAIGNNSQAANVVMDLATNKAITGSGNLTRYNAAINTTTAEVRFSGDMSGYTGTVTNTSGILTIQSTATSAGGWVLTGGTLKLNTTNDTHIANGVGKPNLEIDGGALNMNGKSETINGLTGMGGFVENDLASTTSTLTLGDADATASFAGGIRNSSGAGGTLAVVKIGNGTQTLAGTNAASSYTVSAGTLQFGGGATDYAFSGTITNNNAAVVFNVATALTDGSIITGSGAFTKVGAGTLTLTNANTYTGNTTIQAGTLALGASGSLAAGASVSISNAATFDVSALASYTLGASAGLTASGFGTTPGTDAAELKGGTTVSLDSRPVTLNFAPTSFAGDSSHPSLYVSSGALTINGAITLTNASGTQLGAGTYTLIKQASGSISGTPFLAGGAVQGSGVAPGLTPVIVVSGSEVQLIVGTFTATTTALTRHAGTGSSTTYGDSLSFDVAVTPNAATGTVNLFDGGVSGTLIGSGPLSGGSATITPALNALTAGTHNNIVAVYVGDFTTYAGSTSSALAPAQVVAQKSLTVTGATANSKYYDGTTAAVITNGSLVGVVTGDTVTLNQSGSFNSAGPGTGIGVTANCTLGGAASGNYMLTQPSGLAADIRSTAVWTGAVDTNWATAGNWDLNLVPSLPGVTNDFSTLDITTDTNVSLSSARISGGMIFGDTDTSTPAGWTVSGSTLTLSNNTATPAIVVNALGTGKVVTIGSLLAGSQGMTKMGNGTLVLTNTTSTSSSSAPYLGGTKTINQGTLRIDTSAWGTGKVCALGTNAVVSTLELYGTNMNVDGILLTYTNTVISGTGTINKTGAGYLDIGGGSGAGAPSIKNFTGQLNVQAGCLAINATDLGDATSYFNLDVAANAFFDLRIATNAPIDRLTGSGTIGTTYVTNATAVNGPRVLNVGNNNSSFTFNGSIITKMTNFPGYNTGATLVCLTKNGSGTFTLTGTNTYAGPTTVNAGTLLVNGNGSLGSNSAVTVAATGTLGGSGTIYGPVTVNGSLAPGIPGGIATLTLNSNLTIAGNLFFKVDKSQPQSNDLAAVTGTLNNTGTGTVTITNLNSNPSFAFANGDKFTLFSQPLANGGAMTISPSSPGPGLAWTNNLAFDGSIGVYSTGVAPSTNAFLTSLVVSSGTLNPAFTTNNLNYSQTNAYLNKNVTVTAFAADAGAKLELSFNGGAFGQIFSGISSAQQTLILPNNTVAVRVTAADNATIQTYNVNVTLQPSLTPAKLTNSVSGSTLTLSWPADHLGWHLQMQTNSLASGLKTSGWVVVPGSDQMTSTNISITKTNPTVFYRITYP
jgi:autotransporter-associated beta strand protein